MGGTLHDPPEAGDVWPMRRVVTFIVHTSTDNREGTQMATLTVFKFPSSGGARAALSTLEDLQKQQLVTLHDAAIVQWPADKRKPKTEQLHNMTGAGALSGTFWGMLFGMLFFVPFLGAAVGAAMGAMSGSMIDVGIDDDFIKQVRDEITPSTSALFLLTSDAVADRVIDSFRGTEMKLIATNLSAEDEQNLREAFEED
jgi:uncharacterized membrane protein